MMHLDMIAEEHKLDRVKRLLDAEVMIDVLTELLVSKGIATEEEVASATAKMKTTEKYEYDVNEAEENIKVFRAMRDTELRETASLHGLVFEDGKLKETHDEAERRTETGINY